MGLIDEVLFGFGTAHMDRERRQPVAVVNMLHVEIPAREVGVGEAILEVVLAWADERGAYGIDAPALPGSRNTKAFFETNGFTARLLIMHRPLQNGLTG